ncbi:uncharacterized protein LOC132797981 [Drosophila nasuta]|uniref:uncharacterized protein LOC132797981 n=1 Tax=Drosophila nasuta TaxID=42062 RepID=UPI00295E5EA1|nr:uncharacterized protein LOC132797981 [Drosophila nasuta]
MKQTANPQNATAGPSRPQNSKRVNSFEARVTPKGKSCDLCSKENHPVRSTPNPTATNVQNFFANNAQNVLLGTAVINVCHLGTSYTARALIDSGSEANFNSERLIQRIKLPFKSVRAQVSGLNHAVAAQSQKLCHFSIGSPTKPRLHIETSAFSRPQADEQLDSLLSKFWEVEDIPAKLIRLLRLRSKCGRYRVTLPFRKPDGIELGHSRSIALAQFLKNENRLSRNDTLKEQYNAVLQEYVDLGHMTPISPQIAPQRRCGSFSTHSGPILQSDLTLQILRWRYYRYVFNADITKMYRQILMDSKHKPFQRILFRTSDGEIRDFELHTVTFGVNCAPFLALRVLSQAEFFQQHSVLKDIPKDHLLREDFLELEDSSTAKTLGIRWQAHDDEFFFMPPEVAHQDSYTKREVLSQIAKLFDPAGWLAPFVIRAKTRVKLQYHGFCDASERAYGAAIYVRVEMASKVSTHLLTAKTKVAPVKSLSVPRLELCGAVLLDELSAALLLNLPAESFQTFFWTDSTIVLAWFNKPPCRWTTFVANRVAKIVQASDAKNWSHVRSEHNPADLASRGVLPQELMRNPLWWHGPEWLHLPSDQWPTSPSPIPEVLLEQRIKCNVAKLPPTPDFLNKFSEFGNALRTSAYVLRFIDRSRKLAVPSSTVVQADELSRIQERLIVMAQRQTFQQEYHCLQSKQQVPSSSSIRNLNPFLDGKGILRACGRLRASHSLRYDESHPISLSYSSYFARLLVRFTHRISLHGGNQVVMRLIRSRFWIPKLKVLVKSTINSCKVCVIYKKRLQTQMMGTCPRKGRPTRDLSRTLDTKAIHLEATSDLTTEKFLAAFSRFIARRGCPYQMYSDNGKTFVGADKVISNDFLEATRECIIAQHAHESLSWHVKPPGARIWRGRCRVCRGDHHTLLHFKAACSVRPNRQRPPHGHDPVPQHGHVREPHHGHDPEPQHGHVPELQHDIRDATAYRPVRGDKPYQRIIGNGLPAIRHPRWYGRRLHGDHPLADIRVPSKVLLQVDSQFYCRPVDGENLEQFRSITLADERWFQLSMVSLVFGTDVYPHIIQPGLLPSTNGLPMAQNSTLGWILSGPFGQ